MTQHSRSLLRELSSSRQRREEIDTAQAQGRGGPLNFQNPFVTNDTPTEGPFKGIEPVHANFDNIPNVINDPTSLRAESIRQNQSIAQRLLQEPGISDARRQRLENIANVEDADSRKRQQEVNDFQLKKIIEQRVNNDDPLTAGEMEQAFQQAQQQSFAISMASPGRLREKMEEKSNAQLDIVNTARDWAAEFGVDEASLASALGVEADTGQLDPAIKYKIYTDLRKERADRGKTNPAHQTAVKNSLSRVNKRIGELEQSPELFSSRSGRLVATSGPLFDTYTALLQQRDELSATQDSFVEKFANPPQRTPPPARLPASVQTRELEPLAQPNQANEFPTDKPYVFSQLDNASVSRTITAMKAQVKRTNQPVSLIHPQTGKILTLRP